MSSTFDRLCSDQLITNYPSHIKNNVHYECIMGSVAYGVSNDKSDMDVYGFSIPSKQLLFPYSYGTIYGFGNPPANFEQFQQHHIMDTIHNREYDINIYNIVKFFQLCMENNPNMVDSLFVPASCVLHSTNVGNHVRDNRKLFLSKQVWRKFKGYAFSQLHKLKDKNIKYFVDECTSYGWSLDITFDEIKEIKSYPSDRLSRIKGVIDKIETNGKRSKRLPLIAKHGFDTKNGYHVVRLLDECEQILVTGDLNLQQSRSHLKAIRNGEWSLDNIVAYFDKKLIYLEDLHSVSKLQYSPNEEVIRNLLLECLEMHYGSLEKVVSTKDVTNRYIVEAYNALEKVMQHM